MLLTNKYLLFFIYICCQTSVNAQDLHWAMNLGPTTNSVSNGVGENIVLDDSANVYVVGTFNDIIDLDPSPAVANFTPIGTNDLFLAKYDSDGNYIWGFQIGGDEYVLGIGIDITYDNKLLIAGNFGGTAAFNPATGVNDLVSSGFGDDYVAKYDLNGNYISSFSFGNPGGDFVSNVHASANGNIYITGYFQNTADFDPSGGVSNLTSVSSHNAYISCLDELGNFQWVQSCSGSPISNSTGHGIATDTSGNVYWSGTFSDSAKLDNSSSAYSLYGNGGSDGFIAKYDINGNYSYSFPIAGNGNDACLDLLIDHNNDLLAIGYYSASVDFDPSATVELKTADVAQDVFFAKYNNSGNLVWVKTLDGSGYEWGRKIDIDPQNNIYIIGNGAGYMDFDPDTLAIDSSFTSGQSTYVAKYSPAGLYNWSFRIDGSNNGLGLAVDDSNEIYVCGRLWGTGDFNPDSVATYNLTSSVPADVFVAKYGPLCLPTSQNEFKDTCNSYYWHGTILTSTGIYHDTLISALGCDSVFVLDLTIVTINSSVTQTGTLITANESGATYQWLNCPAMTPISGATNQSYTATTNGDYAVIVGNNGCLDTSACVAVTSVGIIENNFGDKLTIYPNPTDGEFSIDLGETYKAVTITIGDLNGKLLQSKTYIENQLLNLKLEESAGVYLVIIESGNKKAVIRMVKE